VPLPDPLPGLVIGYAYLWHEEARRGQEEGSKDRPCVIVLSTIQEGTGTVVTVAPISHSPPMDLETAIELPAETKRRLGLDTERSWAIVSEVNRFRWPGPDLRPIPRSNPPRFSYGLLPAKLFLRMRQRLIDVASRRGAPVVRRTE
jgi:mRNA-degrading endonuclease toxin of MazEF toxin-antitoxin module